SIVKSEELYNYIKIQEREEIHMCRSLDELKQRGIEEGKKEIILKMHNNGLSIEDIIKFIDLDEHKVLKYLKA
ncbi:MAG: hypothetical protein K2P09_00565, partial [Erysipelotrichales bacterium]|nr:hypothetical protein [Erysipelotrichales bacterium]